MKESGLIEHWIEVEQDKVARLAQKETGTAEVGPLSVSNLQVSSQHFAQIFSSLTQGPFYMWSLFLCISCVVFLVEVCLGHLDRKPPGRNVREGRPDETLSNGMDKKEKNILK